MNVRFNHWAFGLIDGGGGGIRTPETLSGLTVFKTAGFNRSPTPPALIIAATGNLRRVSDSVT
jgi:hypothetical protein